MTAAAMRNLYARNPHTVVGCVELQQEAWRQLDRGLLSLTEATSIVETASLTAQLLDQLARGAENVEIMLATTPAPAPWRGRRSRWDEKVRSCANVRAVRGVR
jgi:hypothetical protein